MNQTESLHPARLHSRGIAKFRESCMNGLVDLFRGDAVAAKALGLRGMVSEDSVRRALAAMKPAASEPWMRSALMSSVRQALDRPWVLDLDATIKPLYGRQEGAEVGYNPHKPGRPSHVLHTFWVGNLRLVLELRELGLPVLVALNMSDLAYERGFALDRARLESTGRARPYAELFPWVVAVSLALIALEFLLGATWLRRFP